MSRSTPRSNAPGAVVALLVPLSCLPLDDLGNYSSEWERPTSDVASIRPLDASSPAEPLGDAGATESPALDASVPLEPAANDAGATAADAGASAAGDDAGGEALDAGALDAAAAP